MRITTSLRPPQVTHKTVSNKETQFLKVQSPLLSHHSLIIPPEMEAKSKTKAARTQLMHSTIAPERLSLQKAVPMKLDSTQAAGSGLQGELQACPG